MWNRLERNLLGHRKLEILERKWRKGRQPQTRPRMGVNMVQEPSVLMWQPSLSLCSLALSFPCLKIIVSTPSGSQTRLCHRIMWEAWTNTDSWAPDLLGKLTQAFCFLIFFFFPFSSYSQCGLAWETLIFKVLRADHHSETRLDTREEMVLRRVFLIW